MLLPLPGALREALNGVLYDGVEARLIDGIEIDRAVGVVHAETDFAVVRDAVDLVVVGAAKIALTESRRSP
jgi:hypothetical protein